MIDITVALDEASLGRRDRSSAEARMFVATVSAALVREYDWDVDAGENWATTVDESRSTFAFIFALAPLVFCGLGQAQSIRAATGAQVVEVLDFESPELCADANALASLFDESLLNELNRESFSVQELYFWTV